MTEGLFGYLRQECRDDWAGYVDHSFLKQLANGTLPESSFRHYLMQDYLFLIQFARAYGLAAFKSETIEDLRAASGGLSAIIDQELELHIAYCAGWELSEADLAHAAEATATIAYTRFVLDCGMAGDLLDLLVALAPCVIGYAEIGRRLIADPATSIVNNRYRAWIEAYAGEDYQRVASAHQQQMQALMLRRGAPERLPALVGIFGKATRLEADFWQMGLDVTA